MESCAEAVNLRFFYQKSPQNAISRLFGNSAFEKNPDGFDNKPLLINALSDYEPMVESDIKKAIVKPTEITEFIQLFVTRQSCFEKEMKKPETLIAKNSRAVLWVSWYKKSPGWTRILLKM